MSKRTRYRVELTDFERSVALDALSGWASSQDPFGFDGNTMVSDSDERESLYDFCAGLRESFRQIAGALDISERTVTAWREELDLPRRPRERRPRKPRG